MLDVGDAFTFEPVVAFRPVEGAHVYEFAPFTESPVELPLQTVAVDGPEITGAALTATATVFVVLHVPDEAVTVYVVEDAGEAMTVEPVVLLRPVAGAHA
jgi:hypothetical protein